jgi:type I restriction enzyme S subunit
LASRSLSRGDIVIERSGGGDQQPVGRAVLFELSDPAVPTNFAGRLRPIRGHLSRYLIYLLSGLYTIGATRSAIKQTTGIQNLDLDAFLNTLVSIPDTQGQREIAAILDEETTRLDTLIEKKQDMIEALQERKSMLFVRALETRGFRWGRSLENPSAGDDIPKGWKIPHLSTVLEQLTNGYVGPTRDVLTDLGVKYIQSLHIKDGEIDFDRRPYYVPDDWHAARPRIHLRPQDVLIVQTGDIGQVAVVPHEFGPASCHALQICRVRREVVTGNYLGAYLRSPFGRQSLLSRVTGALHPHLEGGIRDIPVVVPPLDTQGEVVGELRDCALPIDRLQRSLTRQIERIREHRQTVVTTAVRGWSERAAEAAA